MDLKEVDELIKQVSIDISSLVKVGIKTATIASAEHVTSLYPQTKEYCDLVAAKVSEVTFRTILEEIVKKINQHQRQIRERFNKNTTQEIAPKSDQEIIFYV